MDMETECVRLIICLGSAGLSLFLQMTMSKGMIARKYYSWLYIHYVRKCKTSPFKALLKPLGLCIYCYSVHIFLACYLSVVGFDMLLPIHLGLFYICLSELIKRYGTKR